MKSIRANITDAELEWLNAEAERLGISRSEVLRRIIDVVREAWSEKEA